MKINFNLTQAQIKRFPSYTTGAICGILYIRKMSSKRIAKYLGDKKAFRRLHERMGLETNPTWIHCRLAEQLYDRGVIDVVELLEYCR